jgi:hypothetical protein
MAKTRINKKEQRRLYEKQQYAIATQVRLMAQALANQAQLDTVLLQEKDVEKRKALFNFMKPFLKFADPHLPTELIQPKLIFDPFSRTMVPQD